MSVLRPVFKLLKHPLIGRLLPVRSAVYLLPDSNLDHHVSQTSGNKYVCYCDIMEGGLHRTRPNSCLLLLLRIYPSRSKVTAISSKSILLFLVWHLNGDSPSLIEKIRRKLCPDEAKRTSAMASLISTNSVPSFNL